MQLSMCFLPRVGGRRLSTAFIYYHFSPYLSTTFPYLFSMNFRCFFNHPFFIFPSDPFSADFTILSDISPLPARAILRLRFAIRNTARSKNFWFPRSFFRISFVFGQSGYFSRQANRINVRIAKIRADQKNEPDDSERNIFWISPKTQKISEKK